MTVALLYALLLFAAWIVVPLADPRPALRIPWLCGAIALTLAVAFPAHGVILAGGWALFTLVNAFGPTLAWLRGPGQRSRWRLVDLLRLSAPLHLVVGAVWACLTFAEYRLDGYPWIITPLTAIHFHFAGFAAAHLAANSLERLQGDARWPAWGGGLLLIGVPGLAIGFLTAPIVKLAAAGAVSLGMLTLAIASLRRVDRLGAGRRWIAASWAAILLSMVLSGIYALGEFSGGWWLQIPPMVWSHGILNALVFAGCGVIGWRVEGRR